MTASQPPQPPAGEQSEQGSSAQQPAPGRPAYGQPSPAYGTPPAAGSQGQPGRQPPPPGYGEQPPPGYALQPGFGPPPGYGPPAGYAPPPGYGSPPGYGPPPGYGQPAGYGPPSYQPGSGPAGYGPPGYGPPGYGPPGYGPPGYGSPGYGPPPTHGRPARSEFSFDLKRLKIADYLIPVGTALYFAWALLPWETFGDDFFGFSRSGLGFGNVAAAFVLLVLATAWAFLPAFVDLKLGFPRSWVTVGLAALAWLLTLFAWLQSLDSGFTVWPLLGFLTSTAVVVVAGLSLILEIRRPAPGGGPADAAQPANPSAPDPGQGTGSQWTGSQWTGSQGTGSQGTGSQQPPGQEPSYPQPAPYSSPPPPPPQSTGGSTASGEGSGTTGSGGRTSA